jgi:hypothetical protein
MAQSSSIQEPYCRHGGAREDGQITCDGVEMSIGWELYSALKQLREVDEEGELRIWVDALCINQIDLAEGLR